jgi:ribonuclease Y
VILKKRAKTLLKEAEQEGENIKREKILQAKEKFLQLKTEHEQLITERNNKISQAENKLKQREITMNQQNAEIQRKTKEITSMKETLATQMELAEKKVEEYEKLRLQQIEKIESMASMSAEEAKALLMENMKEEAKSQAMSYISEVMDEARLTAGKEVQIEINKIFRLIIRQFFSHKSVIQICHNPEYSIHRIGFPVYPEIVDRYINQQTLRYTLE